jgi:glycosyltransferase involved in cell wall biosynthesis
MSTAQSYFVLSCSLYQINYTRRELLRLLLEDSHHVNIITLAVVYRHGNTPVISPKVTYKLYKNLVHLYLRTFLSIVRQGRVSSTIISFSPLMNIYGFFMSFLGFKHIAIVSGLGRFGYNPLRLVYQLLLSIGSQSKLVLMNQHDLSFVLSVNQSIRYQYIPSEGIQNSLYHHVNLTQKLNKPTILFMARLLRSKGVFSFLELLRVSQEYEFNFIILGEGSPKFEKYFEKLDSHHENITYHKRLSEQEKYCLLNQCTHFFYQSFYFEGAPLTLLEAQIFNLVPIFLVSRIGSSLLYESDSDRNLSIDDPCAIIRYILETLPKSRDLSRHQQLYSVISREHDRYRISSQIASFISGYD